MAEAEAAMAATGVTSEYKGNKKGKSPAVDEV